MPGAFRYTAGHEPADTCVEVRGLTAREFTGEDMDHGEGSFDAACAALSVNLFAALNEEERQALAACSRFRFFAPAETLFRQGQARADPMLLLSGMVKLCRATLQGRECVLHLARPGRLLDAGVLFYMGGLPISAVGVREGHVLCLERRALLSVLAGNAGLGLALLAGLSLRQRLFINKIAGSQGRVSVSGGVAAWLLHRAKMEKSQIISLGVTREMLARQMGISRESLNRELGLLAAAGLIVKERRRIILLDTAALQKRADG